MIKHVKKTLFFVGAALNVFCVGHCLVEYGGEITILTGPSMQPTFNNRADNNIVFSERATSAWRKFKKNDIVIAKSPVNPDQLICKRITALEGSKVERPSKLYHSHSSGEFIKVPKGHVWLLGDNLDNSTDSRTYGPIPLGLVRGRVCLKLWPPSEFGWVE